MLGVRFSLTALCGTLCQSPEVRTRTFHSQVQPPPLLLRKSGLFPRRLFCTSIYVFLPFSWTYTAHQSAILVTPEIAPRSPKPAWVRLVYLVRSLHKTTHKRIFRYQHNSIDNPDIATSLNVALSQDSAAFSTSPSRLSYLCNTVQKPMKF